MLLDRRNYFCDKFILQEVKKTFRGTSRREKKGSTKTSSWLKSEAPPYHSAKCKAPLVSIESCIKRQFHFCFTGTWPVHACRYIFMPTPWINNTWPSSFIDQWICTHCFYVVNRRQGMNWKIGSGGPWGDCQQQGGANEVMRKQALRIRRCRSLGEEQAWHILGL
jgi:hypothetical protein